MLNEILEEASPYSQDIDQMMTSLDEILPQFAGGLGRYRLAKTFEGNRADGILAVSSMYENTATILKILREKYKKAQQLPVLDLYFDCNKKEDHKEVLDTFLSYL